MFGCIGMQTCLRKELDKKKGGEGEYGMLLRELDAEDPEICHKY